MNLLRARWFPGALVVAVTLGIFLPAIENGWVNWDDDENFLWNPYYRGLGWPQIRWMFTSAQQSVYCPVAWLTLGLDHVVWGMNPSGYHLTSILLHAANAGLVYLLAHRLLAFGLGAEPAGAGSPADARGHDPGAAADAGLLRLGATAAALLFSVHPLRVESVAWITERRDVVVGLFSLLTVLAYLRANRPSAGRAGHAVWYGTTLACFGLALLSKGIVVALPLVLLALDVYPLGRAGRAGHSRPALRSFVGLVVEKLPFLVLAAAISVLTLAILASRGLLASRESLGILERLALSAHALVFYLRKMLVPWPLSPLYTLWYPIAPLSARYLVPMAAVILLTALAIVLGRRWPAGLVTWIAYVALLLPVLGFFHSGPQAAADRYTYLASIPWAVLGGAGITWCGRRARSGSLSPALARLAAGGAVVLIAGHVALTIPQIAVWRDSVALWTHAAVVEPDSDIPIFYLGWALAGAGRFDEARAHFDNALARVPAGLPGLRAQLKTELGIVAQRAGDPARAESEFREALAVDPQQAVAMIRLGGLLLARGENAGGEAMLSRAGPAVMRGGQKVWEIRQALEEVSGAAPETRGRLAFAFGVLLQQRHALDDAERQYRSALALLPGATEAWNNLGVTYATRGRYEEALDAFVAALRVEPGHREACRNGLHAADAAHRKPRELHDCPALIR